MVNKMLSAGEMLPDKELLSVEEMDSAEEMPSDQEMDSAEEMPSKNVKCLWGYSERPWPALAAAALGAMLLLGGCGQRTSYLLKIYDAGARTEMLVYEGTSLADSLADAGIEVSEKDEISYSVDTSVTEDMDIDIARYARVTITNDKDVQEVELTGGKVQDALDEAGVTLKDHDYLNVDEDEWLYDGEEIVVTHRVEVTLTVDGETKTELTEAKTVRAFLKEQGVKVGKLDRMNYAKKKKLKEGMEIVIQRVEEKEEKETQTVAFSSTTENNSSMAKGKTQVKTAGVNGEKEITYKVTYVDGVEESREIVSEVVTKEPVTEVIYVGTYVAPSKSGSGGSGSGGGKTVVSKEYYDDCDGSGHGVCVITYSDGSVVYQDY